MRPSLVASAVCLLLVLLAVPRPVAAVGLADEAELHFQLGAERYLAKDFRGALEHFMASNRLVPNRNVVFNIARSFEQLRRFADAHRYYVDALAEETDAAVRQQIEAAMARIAPQVAVLDVVTDPPGATIYIDRKDLGSRGTSPRPLALAPGRYQVLVELPGHEEAVSGVVEAALGTTTRVELRLPRILGTVKVEGDAGGRVHLDDELAPPRCEVPCELALPPGAYTLYVTREGHRTWTRSVKVTAHAVSEVRASLSPLTGTVVVTADEREALVELDGVVVGFTPVVVPSVPVGRRSIRVSLRGFAPVELAVEVVANQQVSLEDVRLEPIREVTAASRFTETIEDAPSSVSIVPSQELRAFAYPTIAEALRGIRGISVSHDSIYSSLNVRGIGQPNDYGNRVVVLADGMVLNDDIVSSSYVGFDGRTDLGDVERIEVVRGAGSVLYGTGAMSGVINLVTRGRDAPDSAHASIGTAENGVGRVRAGFHYNLGEDAGIWASVGLARSDGYQETLGGRPGVATTTTASGFDAFESGTTAGRIWWGPLTAQWFYTSRDQETPVGAYGSVVGDGRTRLADRRAMGEVRYEPKLGDFGELLVRGFANTYRFRGRYQYGDAEQILERYEGTWVGGEARFVLTPLEDPRRLRISVGGMGERHLRANMRGEAIEGAERETFLEEDHPYTVGAAYALVEGSPASWFRFSLGGRYDHYSTFGGSFNPRLALIFRSSEEGVLKVMGGKGFRAPSIYELYYNDGGVSQVASEGLTAETSYSGEVEYAHRLSADWTGLVSVHGSYFDKLIETRGAGTPDAPLTYANSDAPVVTAGADLELRREWRQGWMLSVAYGVQTARYLELPEDAESDNPRLINVPGHIASLRGAAPIVPGLATLASRLSVEGPRRISLADDAETRPAIIADVVLSGELSRYGVRYAAGVYNLFDWRYAVPITEGFGASTFPQRGRTLLVELILSI